MLQMLKFYKPTEARRTDINSNQTRLCAQHFHQTPPTLTALHQASKVLEIYTHAYMQMQSRLYVNKHTVCVQDTVFAGNSHHFTGAELDFHHVCQQRQ